MHHLLTAYDIKPRILEAGTQTTLAPPSRRQLRQCHQVGTLHRPGSSSSSSSWSTAWPPRPRRSRSGAGLDRGPPRESSPVLTRKPWRPTPRRTPRRAHTFTKDDLLTLGGSLSWLRWPSSTSGTSPCPRLSAAGLLACPHFKFMGIYGCVAGRPIRGRSWWSAWAAAAVAWAALRPYSSRSGSVVTHTFRPGMEGLLPPQLLPRTHMAGVSPTAPFSGKRPGSSTPSWGLVRIESVWPSWSRVPLGNRRENAVHDEALGGWNLTVGAAECSS